MYDVEHGEFTYEENCKVSYVFKLLCCKWPKKKKKKKNLNAVVVTGKN